MERLLTASWWALVLVIALCASGLIQWLKGFAKTAPTWTWGLLLPLLCLVLATAWQPWPWLLAAGLLSLAIAQLGYDTLLRGMLAWASRLGAPDVRPAMPGPPA